MGITIDKMADSTQHDVTEGLNTLIEASFAHSVDKGFAKEGQRRNPAELIALIHSELSECLEYIRHGNPTSEKIGKFSGAEEELADALIRICDMAGEFGYDLAGAVMAKMRFNRTRPHRHGAAF